MNVQHMGHPRVGRPQGSWWLQHKDMGTHADSSSLMQIANRTVRHQQHIPPRHSQKKRRCLEAQGDLKISESSAQKLLHKLQYRKDVELLEQTGPKNERAPST